MAWGPFLKDLEKFSDPESRSKISNLLITELFCSCILKRKRCFRHTISFRRVHLSVIRHRLTKNGFAAGPKSFRAFGETGPWLLQAKWITESGARHLWSIYAISYYFDSTLALIFCWSIPVTCSHIVICIHRVICNLYLQKQIFWVAIMTNHCLETTYE